MKDQRDKNKKICNDLNNLTNTSSGNVNICKILYKIRDSWRMSVENIWVNTIEYLIMYIQCKNGIFNNGTIYICHWNINLTWNICMWQWYKIKYWTYHTRIMRLNEWWNWPGQVWLIYYDTIDWTNYVSHTI